jgi:hypothetical protein
VVTVEAEEQISRGQRLVYVLGDISNKGIVEARGIESAPRCPKGCASCGLLLPNCEWWWWRDPGLFTALM